MLVPRRLSTLCDAAWNVLIEQCMARALEDRHAIVVCQTLDISTYFAYGAALLHEVLEQATDVDRKLGEGLALTSNFKCERLPIYVAPLCGLHQPLRRRQRLRMRQV